jgi:DNA ligase N terminus
MDNDNNNDDSPHLSDDADDDDDEIDNNNNNVDEEAAEGEQPIAPRLEPSEARINRLYFRDICMRLEMISGVKGRKRSDEEKLDHLIPAKMLQALDQASREPGARPESLFPLYRLLLPDMDTRRFNMGEGKLADMYVTTLMLAPTSAKAKMLYNYADPQFVSKAQGQSDLSSVIQYVVQDHKGIPANAKQKQMVGSDWTIGEINQMLNEFVQLPLRHKKAKDVMLRKYAASPQTKKPKVRTLRDIQSDWLRTLYNDGEKKGLSPIEHKWLARILLKKQMKFGLVRRRL